MSLKIAVNVIHFFFRICWEMPTPVAVSRSTQLGTSCRHQTKSFSIARDDKHPLHNVTLVTSPSYDDISDILEEVADLISASQRFKRRHIANEE